MTGSHERWYGIIKEHLSHISKGAGFSRRSIEAPSAIARVNSAVSFVLGDATIRSASSPFLGGT